MKGSFRSGTRPISPNSVSAWEATPEARTVRALVMRTTAACGCCHCEERLPVDRRTTLLAIHTAREGFGSLDQVLDRHGHDIGSSPCGRNANFAEWRRESLRDHSADDSRDPALAIEHGCSRSAVVDRKPIIPVIHFEESGAREPAVVHVLHEPAARRTWSLVWIGECHETIFGHERRHTNCNAPGGRNSVLQLQHGQFFRTATRQTLNAGNNRLTIGGALNIEWSPVLSRQPHCGGDMFDGDKSGRRHKPTGALDADQVGLSGAFYLVKISRDADGRGRQEC